MVIPIGDIRLHPDLPWGREGLSMNNEMTLALMDELDEVLTNAVGEWNWWHLSSRVPIGDIRARPDLPWDRYGLSQNKEMTVDVMNHLDHVMTNSAGEWDWWHLSSKVPMDEIRLHPDLPWDRRGLSQNNEITVEAMNYLDHVMTSATDEWEWWHLPSRVPIGDIRLHPDLPWDREGLSGNKDITVALMDELDEVLTSATGEWDWYDLSVHVPMEEIRLHPDLPWDAEGLSLNPGVTVDDVVYLGVEGDIDSVVPMEEIKANPLWPWNRRAMSLNPRITMEMVLANPD